MRTAILTTLALALMLAACDAVRIPANQAATAPAQPAPAPTTNRAPAPAATGPGPGGKRVKLWDSTPAVVAGQDQEGNPTEPTMDIYLPPSDKIPAAGATAVVIFP